MVVHTSAVDGSEWLVLTRDDLTTIDGEAEADLTSSPGLTSGCDIEETGETFSDRDEEEEEEEEEITDTVTGEEIAAIAVESDSVEGVETSASDWSGGRKRVEGGGKGRGERRDEGTVEGMGCEPGGAEEAPASRASRTSESIDELRDESRDEWRDKDSA